MINQHLQQRIQQRLQTRRPPSPPPGNGAPDHEEAKRLLDTSAGTNRNLFIAFNLLLATALILCLSVTDEQLLLDNTLIPLPFINVGLPTWAFASVLPLFVLVLHFDLLHNLHEHVNKLQNWVAAREKKFPPAPTGTAASAKNVQLTTLLFPFLYDFAWLHAKGKGPDSINLNFLPALCWLIYCWAPYSVLLIFLIRFADLQSYFYTGWHLLLVGLDVAFLYWYWPRFGAAQSRLRAWRWIRKFINFPVVMLLFSTSIATWSFTLYCLIQRHLDADGSAEWVQQAIDREGEYKPKFGLTLVPRIVMPGYWIKLDAKHFTLAEIEAPDKNKAVQWPLTPAPANLSGRRLGFADFSGVHMPRVDFTKANLKGANLRGAQLQGASLDFAQLQRADLIEARLQGAHLEKSQLQGASLDLAQLQGADLSSALLQGAQLIKSQLQGAQLTGSELQGAILVEANLQGTNMYGSNLQGADLRYADLRGATLDDAQLQGANLQYSNLQGADLDSAKLQGADLNNAMIKGSVLKNAQLHAAKLPEAKEFAATSGQVDWKTPFDIATLTGSTWFQSLSAKSKATTYNGMPIRVWTEDKETLGKRLKETGQRAKEFVVPILPPADAALFSDAWLELVCENAANADEMLSHDFRKLPNEISDEKLKGWMKDKPKCQPYKRTAEFVMASRKGESK